MVQKSLRRTWWGHMVGAPGRGTSYQHESSGSGGGSSRLPTPQTGTMITHTHSHYAHTPKDIIRTQKKSFGEKITAKQRNFLDEKQRCLSQEAFKLNIRAKLSSRKTAASPKTGMPRTSTPSGSSASLPFGPYNVMNFYVGVRCT